jgi:hypothetical protein
VVITGIGSCWVCGVGDGVPVGARVAGIVGFIEDEFESDTHPLIIAKSKSVKIAREYFNGNIFLPSINM